MLLSVGFRVTTLAWTLSYLRTYHDCCVAIFKGLKYFIEYTSFALGLQVI